MEDVINRRLLRSLRLTLYTLKRQFAGSIYIYQLEDSETDYVTGVKTSTQKVYSVSRAIVLPIKIQRDEVKTLSIVSANKSFVYGGTYDAGVRLFVIDARDVPTDLDLKLDDWVVYNGQRYSIKSIDKLELQAGWLIVGRAIEQATGTLAHEEILHNLAFTDNCTQVVL